jgi:hypothetical protein
MEALGRVFNVIHSASGVHIPLKDASAVTFFGFENDGATEIALIESKGAGVSETALTTVTRHWVSDGVGGAWTLVEHAATATVTPADGANDCWLFTVAASELSDGFTHVEATADGGTCIAIVHDLNVQRDPAKLAALV